jgi:hypothetical protein
LFCSLCGRCSPRNEAQTQPSPHGKLISSIRPTSAAHLLLTCWREAYASSTRFFHIQLSVFEIRTNNYRPWIQLTPSFFSLPPSSFLSPQLLPRAAGTGALPPHGPRSPLAPQTPPCALPAVRASACPAGRAPRAAAAPRVARTPALPEWRCAVFLSIKSVIHFSYLKCIVLCFI